MDALVERVLRWHRPILVGWVIALVVLGALASGLADKVVPGGQASTSSGSEQAARDLERSSVPSLFVVFEWDRGTRPAERRAALGDATAKLRDTAGVVRVRPFEPVAGGPRDTQRGSVSTLNVTTAGGFDGAQHVAERLAEEQGDLVPADVGEHYVGGIGAYNYELTERAREDLSRAERFGLPIVFVVLLLTFGSFRAAAIPMLIAMSALVMGLGVLSIVAEFVDISEYVTNAASMIGIALGVDYAMFLVQRVRERLRQGDEPPEAIAAAMRTTGTAVLWSGLTVLIAESAMFLVDARAIRSAALGMMLVTLFAMVAAVVITPIAFLLLGRRLMPRGEQRAAGPSRWVRWGRTVTGRAPLLLTVSALVMIALALPLKDLDENVNVTSASTLPADSTVRKAYEVAAEQYGPGALSPVQVVVRGDGGPPSADRLDRARRTVARDRRVAGVQLLPPARGASGETQVVPMLVTPRAGGFTEPTRDLVEDLRSGPLARAFAPFDYDVGGETATGIDTKDAVFDSLPAVLAVLLAMVAIVLFVAFRSVFLPLKAALVVVLTLAASLGALVLLTQSELGADLIGQGEPTDMVPFVPILIVTVVIALSTDYEVILISRIAEHYRRSGDNTESIVEGVGQTGRVITSAGAIMFAVFFGFALADLPTLKQLGVGLALSVLLDVTIVRAVMVPATMRVAGRLNWWAPGAGGGPAERERAGSP